MTLVATTAKHRSSLPAAIRQSFWLALACLCWSLPATGEPKLPAWHSLEFEASYLWVTATARLEVNMETTETAAKGWLNPEQTRPLQPYGPKVWRLDVANSINGNTESISSWLDPQNLRAYQRTRQSKGKQQRLKLYRYLQQGVWRERREYSGSDASGSPMQWPTTSKGTYKQPQAMPGNARLLSPYSLLLLASSAELNKIGDSVKRYVYTDLDFLQASLTLSGTETITINYSEDSQSQSGEVEALVLDLATQPISGADQQDPFSLMGLSGNIQILLHPQSRLPVQIRGKAPRVGDFSLQLSGAQRQPPGVD